MHRLLLECSPSFWIPNEMTKYEFMMCWHAVFSKLSSRLAPILVLIFTRKHSKRILVNFQLRNPSYEDAESNWFSLRSAIATHAKFLKLDEDRNGELSKADLKSLTSYTSVFIDRLFAEYIHHGT